MAKKDKKNKADKVVEKVKSAKRKVGKRSKTGKADKQPVSTRIITLPCRSSYMFVNEPREDDDGNMVYSSQVIIPKKDTKTIAKIEAATKLAAQQKFGAKVKLGQLKLPMRDADKEERDGGEYKGMFFLNSKSFRKPDAVDRSNTKIIGEDRNEMLYSGGFYRFSLTFKGFDNRGNKGVCVALNNIMFHKHSDRLDGGVDAEKEFEDYGEEQDEFED